MSRRPEERSRWVVPIIGISLVGLTLWGLLMATGGESSLVTRRIQATDIARRMVEDATAYASDAVNPLLAKVGLGTTDETKADSAPKPAPPTATRPAARPAPRARNGPAAEPVLVSNVSERGPFSEPAPEENAPTANILAMEEAPTLTLLEAGFNGRVFGELDEGVTTPRPLQPLLPSSTPRGLPREELGIAEYIVDHRGRVESVKLIKEPARFQDRMVLSVIKAWRFEPAYKDGQPVRYRQTIVLTY